MSGDSSEFQRPVTGSFTATGQSVDITSPNQSTEVIQFIGTWVGSLIIEGCNDGVNYKSITLIDSATGLPVINSTITAPGLYIGQTNSYEFLRVRSLSWTSGTANLYTFGSDSASIVSAISLLRGATDGSLIGNIGDALKVVEGPITGQTEKVIYNEVTSVANSVQTQVAFYTVPVSKTAVLRRVSVSGDNFARFDVLLNGNPIDTKRTWFSDFNANFEFIASANSGLTLNASDVISVQVLHTRPFVGSFEARIQVLEIS